jgi:hypothetical protein
MEGPYGIKGWSGPPSKTMTEARIRAALRALDRDDVSGARAILERMLKKERKRQSKDLRGAHATGHSVADHSELGKGIKPVLPRS